jgi:hypothetical protein
MGIRIKIFAVIIGLCFFFAVLRVIKRGGFRPSYSTAWIAIALFLISIPVFEFFYKWVATSALGIVDARHIIYVVLIGFLLVYAFYLTTKISRMSDQIQELISYTSILEKRLQDSNKTDSPDTGRRTP